MNTTSLLVLFATFIIIFNIIIEIFTVLFRLTGITKEKARTQVLSLLTNCGFTTKESEVIISSRRRRKLAQITMLFGYSFSVVIVSMLVNLFMALKQSEVTSMIPPILILAVMMTIIFLVMHLESVQNRFDFIIEKIGNRLMYGKKSNVLILIDIYNKKAMVEAVLSNIPIFLENVPLSKSYLKERFDIQILFIRRNNEMLDVINGDTLLVKGDKLVLFGNYKNIREIFEHPNSE